ncbi:MAG: hypothetical protein PHH37_00090 [Paludibacter sp.]|nr:hypothetical protein [Paludibacter sp.]
MKKFTIIAFALFFTYNAFGKNPYMTQGTKEFTEVTSKLLGTWDIEFLGKKQNNEIGTTYQSGTVELKFDQSSNNWTATFRFSLPQSTIDSRISAWNKKGETIAVDSYEVVSEFKFGIHKKGDIIYFENQNSVPDIKGSGEQLENFVNTESVFIASQSSLKNEGGLGGLVASAAIKGISGANFIPKVPSQVNYKNLTDNSVDFISIQKINLTLKKQP